MTPRRTAVSAPRIGALVLPDLDEADAARLSPGREYHGLRFASADLSARELPGIVFTECEFDDLQAHETKLLGARIIESRVQGANAPVLHAARTTWRDVRISDSRLGAVEMSDADLTSVLVSESKLSFVNLRGSRLRDVRFDRCVIDELDLGGADAERVAFTETTVRSLRLDRSTLRDVDLRGLDLSNVSGVEAMRGTVITFGQAADLTSAFARALGITVID